MIEMSELFNAERAAEHKAPIAIGFASAEPIAGYTGMQQRATYTGVVDTVNLAARLEAQTKAAQRPILIDGATRAALPATMIVEALGTAMLKGLSTPVDLFAVECGPERSALPGSR